MCIPVHSPWLPGYIDVTQTVLVISNGWTFSEPTFCMLEVRYMKTIKKGAEAYK